MKKSRAAKFWPMWEFKIQKFKSSHATKNHDYDEHSSLIHIHTTALLFLLGTWKIISDAVLKMGIPGGSVVKNKPACQGGRHKDIYVRSLGQEDPLEKEIATYSNILAWEIPCFDKGAQWNTVQGITKELDTTWCLSNNNLEGTRDYLHQLGSRKWEVVLWSFETLNKGKGSNPVRHWGKFVAVSSELCCRNVGEDCNIDSDHIKLINMILLLTF